MQLQNNVSSLFVPLLYYIYADEKEYQVIWEIIFNIDLKILSVIIKKEQLKYPLKFVPAVQMIFWNRDVNAVINIRDVLIYYFNSGINVDSQHPSLCYNKN
ncbi:hypothetical protein K501DRAFT_271975 [Backusella circina FSU 941]|nr:hypothetical protein K501DRAFT_271975 [Backusella circina FSU 941]